MSQTSSLRASLLPALAFVAALWLLKTLELLLSWPLTHWGIAPRSAAGLSGIVLAPLLHGSWQHLFANTAPLLVLGTALHYGYPRACWRVLGLVWLVCGVGVWLFARPSLHIGASGLTHGLFFFLFVVGVLRRDRRAIGLLMIAFFLYGGMLLTVFPREPGVSYESHAFGALGGVLAALLWHRRDATPPRRSYSWESEPEDAEDPVIGDAWKHPVDTFVPGSEAAVGVDLTETEAVDPDDRHA